MCGKNLMFWYCALLFFLVVSSKLQQNSTSNKEKNNNLTIRHEIDANSTTNYDDKIKRLQHEKSTNNTYDNMQYNDMQYESRTTFTNNDGKDDNSIQYKLGMHSIQNYEDDKQMPMESGTNSTNNNHNKIFTSQESYRNLMSIEDKNDSTSYELENINKSSIVSYDVCYNIICIQFCCPFGNRLDNDSKCIPEDIKYILPNVHTNDSLQNENKKVDELFPLVIYDPCQKYDRFLLPKGYHYNYIIFANGSLYLSDYEIFVTSTSYCLAIVEGYGDTFQVSFCSETFEKITNLINYILLNEKKENITHMSFNIVSLLFLVSTFLVYSILPDLRNTAHGFMLRNYTGALSIASIINIINVLAIKANDIHYPVCVTIAFFDYFFSLTSFFWLNVMSFDMWWTIRGFFSLRRNVRHRKKNRLIFYAIYAWGLPFIFAIICIIMEFVSKNLPEIMQPKFLAGDCWFAEKGSYMLYYYGFKSICIISSIFLSIFTVLKIARYENDTHHRLTVSESKRYNNNKEWFNLYLKLYIILFIVMGIKLSMVMLTAALSNIPNYLFYAIYLMDVIQNLCTFIIFVWKKKIKQMLLERFCSVFPHIQRTTVRTNVTSSSISTCTATSGEMPMQKKMNSCE